MSADEGEETTEVTAEEQRGSFLFGTLEEFVTEFLSPVFRRDVRGPALAWCPSWWLHPEAISRLATLWRSFEYLRNDGWLGMSNWWLHHLDPHMAVLTDPVTGPFSSCANLTHNPDAPGPLPLDPLPPEVMDHESFSVFHGDPFATADLEDPASPRESM